mmetsp:Transcript_42766/g.56467  ORF Transcript_42766/g.56467 Transcript_42766/m.56467 type:complete len:99 (+) Transcript_42766:362-658(+)
MESVLARTEKMKSLESAETELSTSSEKASPCSQAKSPCNAPEDAQHCLVPCSVSEKRWREKIDYIDSLIASMAVTKDVRMRRLLKKRIEKARIDRQEL